jgi:hypothetical protein
LPWTKAEGILPPPSFGASEGGGARIYFYLKNKDKILREGMLRQDPLPLKARRSPKGRGFDLYLDTKKS